MEDPQTQQADVSQNDWAIHVVLGAIVFVFFLWLVPTIIRTIHDCCCKSIRRTQTQARQEAVDQAIGRLLLVTEAESVRAGVLQRTVTSNLEERRKSYIENVLMKKKYKEYKESLMEEKETIDMKAEGSIISESVAGSEITIWFDDEECGKVDDICAICLSRYDDDDDVAWSRNEQCNHVFHRSCIAEWLKRNEECPFCRKFFLHFDKHEDGERDARSPAALAGFLTTNEALSILDAFRGLSRVHGLVQQVDQDFQADAPSDNLEQRPSLGTTEENTEQPVRPRLPPTAGANSRGAVSLSTDRDASTTSTSQATYSLLRGQVPSRASSSSSSPVRSSPKRYPRHGRRRRR